MALLAKLMQGAHTFVALGASFGQFSKLACETLTNATVVAVEADPLRVDVLRDNAAKWSGRNGNRLEVVQAAVASHRGTMSFQITNSCVSGGLFRHALDHLDNATRDSVNWTEVTVPTVTLDEMFPKDPPDFVKMDIEGAELLALRGATEILRKHRTIWFIELHHFSYTDERKTSELVIELMRFHGLREVYIDQGVRCLFLKNPWRQLPRLALWTVFVKAGIAARKASRFLLGKRRNDK